ncbi:MAG: GlsB/YeaQ/YmgE family stress response membrane protein [Chloroflexota bacterium]
MSTLDVLSWIVVGLIAGGLIDAITPSRTPGRSAVALAGVVGAVAGGAAVGGLSGMNAVAFLGAVCAAIPSAVAVAYLFRRIGAGRYHG